MTDLVARLRSRREFASLDGSRWYTTTGPDRDCAEAAEEIERLRERLRVLAAVPAEPVAWLISHGAGPMLATICPQEVARHRLHQADVTPLYSAPHTAR